nr:MAG TPA: hypothetical protein [Caudoviricetes sp.]
MTTSGTTLMLPRTSGRFTASTSTAATGSVSWRHCLSAFLTSLGHCTGRSNWVGRSGSATLPTRRGLTP